MILNTLQDNYIKNLYWFVHEKICNLVHRLALIGMQIRFVKLSLLRIIMAMRATTTTTTTTTIIYYKYIFNS